MDYVRETFKNVKKSLFDDRFNYIALIISIIAFLVEFIIWQELIVRKEVFVYSVLAYYPLELFAAIFVIHVVLAISSYKLDKYISNFLLGFGVFYLFLIFIAEVFYIVNK